jgi:hypothetical protein
MLPRNWMAYRSLNNITGNNKAIKCGETSAFVTRLSQKECITKHRTYWRYKKIYLKNENVDTVTCLHVYNRLAQNEEYNSVNTSFKFLCSNVFRSCMLTT